jgi:hypothetical protein
MRRVFVSLIAASLTLCSMPAFAGPAEDAFLAKIAGTWSGGGAVAGAESGTLACKLTFRPKGARLSFTGRCTGKGFGAAAQSFTGGLLYDDASKHYVAVGNNQTAVGVKSGSSVVFASKIKTMGVTGKSVMTISAASIVIDADVVRGQSGKHYTTHMTFTKK